MRAQLILPVTLCCLAACRPTTGAPTFRGTYTYMADAGRFTDCRTGTAFPVAAAGDNADLERAYATARDAPGWPLLVTFTGHIEDRPGMEEGQVLAHVVVDSFIAVFPWRMCDSDLTAKLPGSAWRLAMVNDQRVYPGTPASIPRIVFGTDGQAHGYSGCNNFSGRYSINADSLRIGPLAMTRRACLEDDLNRQEYTFTSALAGARSWDVARDTLFLSGAAGALRFTRRSPP